MDRARAERDVALAQIARTKAIIARKTIRAPFRARVGIADVHPGQYLNEGTQLTTLQGVDDAAHVDFTVAQQVAAGLREGEPSRCFAGTATASSRRSSRSTRASTRRPAMPWCARGSRRATRRARGLGARPGPGGAAQGRRRSGERAAQGPGRRPRLRDRAGPGRPSQARTSGRSRAARCSATRS